VQTKARPAPARSARRKAAAKSKRFGCETPRLFTPPLRDISTEHDAFGRVTSRGYEAIRFAHEVMGIELLPWQRWLLIHALELTEDGSFRFRIVVLLVARQNGKSTLMQVLTLWRMYVDEAPLVIGTAQSLDVAEEQWLGTVEIAEGIPELAAEIDKVNKTNGKYSLDLVGKQRYKVKAATRKGARGLSGDLVLLDELREHHVWDAWASVTKTTMARERAQIWGASNAGDNASVVLRYLRALGHQGIGFPDGKDGIAEGLRLLEDLANGAESEHADAMSEALSTLGLFEWSAAPGLSVWDRDGWAQANPSMGYTISEATIASAAATDPEPVFRTEVLCQFVAHVSMGPFPAGSWDATLQDVPSRRDRGVTRDTTRPLTYCVDVSVGRGMSYVAVAYWDTEGRIRFELAAQRAGTDWLIPWLSSPDRKVPVDHLTLQRRGAPVSSLWGELDRAGFDLTPWEGDLVPGWYGAFFDRLATAVDPDAPFLQMTHGVQPMVDAGARSAITKKSGDGRMIDRDASPHDAAPLTACIGAVGLLLTDPAPPARSAYEDNEFMVV
jgi:hypothetical protein